MAKPGRPKGITKSQINFMIDNDLKKQLEYITSNYIGHKNRSKIINNAVRKYLTTEETYIDILKKFKK